MRDFRDRGWAWVIAGACFWTSLTCVGIIPSYGVLYSIIINTLNVSREAASWPFTVGNSFTGIGICISGLLHGYFNTRSQVIVASILCFFGIFFCYFVKNIYLICLLFGAINGVGTGILSGCSFVIICQYFDRYTTVATGLFFAGLSLSTSIFPPLMQILSDEYGLNGCMLIVSGIALNSLIGAMLFRSPPHEADIGTDICRIEDLKQHPNDLRTDYESKRKSFRRHVIEQLKEWVGVFKYPMFLLITGCFEMFNFSYCSHLMIIADNAMDMGINEIKASLLISVFSIADLIGRLVIGWIVDFGWIKVKTLLVILYIILGTMYITTPFLTTFTALGVSACLAGFVSGSIITNWSVSLNDYLGINLLFPALSVSSAIFIFISLCLPFLIGHFRVLHGTYHAMFYVFGAMQFLCSLMWLLEPLAMKLQRRVLRLDSNVPKIETGNGKRRFSHRIKLQGESKQENSFL